MVSLLKMSDFFAWIFLKIHWQWNLNSFWLCPFPLPHFNTQLTFDACWTGSFSWSFCWSMNCSDKLFCFLVNKLMDNKTSCIWKIICFMLQNKCRIVLNVCVWKFCGFKKFSVLQIRMTFDWIIFYINNRPIFPFFLQKERNGLFYLKKIKTTYDLP